MFIYPNIAPADSRPFRSYIISEVLYISETNVTLTVVMESSEEKATAAEFDGKNSEASDIGTMRQELLYEIDYLKTQGMQRHTASSIITYN